MGMGLQTFLRMHRGTFMPGVPTGVQEAVGAGIDESIGGTSRVLGKMKHFQDASHHFWNNWVSVLEAQATKLMYFASKLDKSTAGGGPGAVHHHTHIHASGMLDDNHIAQIQGVVDSAHRKHTEKILTDVRNQQ